MTQLCVRQSALLNFDFYHGLLIKLVWLAYLVLDGLTDVPMCLFI